MPYTKSDLIPRANTEGSTLPPRGTTGRYLWQDNSRIRLTDVLSLPVFQGGQFTIEQKIVAEYQIYDNKLITTRERYYTNKYYLGNWQSIDQGNPQQVLHEGKCYYLLTQIRNLYTYNLSFPNSAGFQKGGILSIQQCNFSLYPGTPVSIEIAGVEVDFSTYEIPSLAGNLFRGEFSYAKAEFANNLSISVPNTKLGFYTYQGAALTRVTHIVSQTHSIQTTSNSATAPICPKN